jgi:transposase
MDDVTHLGLDVHKDNDRGGLSRPGEFVHDERTIPNTAEALRALVGRHPEPSMLAACYEAEPTGYDTHRLLTSFGVRCDVIAPTVVPRRAGHGGRANGCERRAEPGRGGGPSRDAPCRLGGRYEEFTDEDSGRRAVPAP